MLWRIISWLLAYLGPQSSELPPLRPDGDDSIHAEEVNGLSR